MADPVSPSIGRVQRLSGIEKADSETVREYLHRVIAEADVETDRERVVGLFLRAQLADDRTLDGRDLEVLRSFYDRLRTDDDPVLSRESETSRQRAEPTEGDSEAEATPERSAPSADKGASPCAESESGPNGTRGSSVSSEDRRDQMSNPTRIQLAPRVRTSLSERFADWDYYDVVALLGLLIVGYRSYLHRLGASPLANWDEGIYAAIASNMVERGYWVVPHLNDGVLPVYFQPYVRTPPLSMWLQATSMTVFGVTVFAARLPAAVATLLTAGVIYYWGRQLFDKTGAFTAAFVFLTTPYVQHGRNAGRDGTPEMVALLFGTLFVYFVWRAVTARESGVFLPTGIVGGAAVLTTGPGAAIFGLVALPLVLRNRSVFWHRDLAKGVVAAVGIVLPWVGVMLYTAPDRFIREAVIRPVLGGGAGDSAGHTASGMFSGVHESYFTQLLVFFDPWGYLLLPCLVVGLISRVRRDRTDDSRTVGYLGWYVAIVILVVALTGQRPWNLLPASVPAALLLGGSVTWFLDGHTEFGVALGGGIGSAALFSIRMGELSPVSIEAPASLDPSVLGVEMVLALCVCAAILVCAHYLLNVSDQPRAGTLGPSLLGVALVVLLVGVPLGTPVAGSTGGSPEQAKLGTDVDAATHDGSMLYVSNDTARGQPLFAFSFHAEVTVRNLGFETVKDLRNGTYAMVVEDERRALEREHYVVARAHLPAKGNVSVIRFG